MNLNKILWTARIIMVLVFILVAWYAYNEIEAIKILGYDACQYCMDKSGAQCFIGVSVPGYEEPLYPTINFSETLNFTRTK